MSAAAIWPVPDPPAIFSQAAATYEARFPGIDARSSYSVAACNGRIVSLTGYDLYLMQAAMAKELMPDTAIVWLPYHANIWNVPQLQPTAGTGFAVFAGTVGLPIPSGTLLSSAAQWLYMTTAAGTIGTGGTVNIPVMSVLPGSAYNLPGGTILNLVSPLGGVVPQSATLDSNGIQNGTDLETSDAWRVRILAAIRQKGQGGNGNDYAQWAADAGAPYCNVVPQVIGAGSVGLFIAAAGPAVASTQLVTAVQNYLGVYGTAAGVRPVTANVIVAAATLVPVNFTLHLNPDTSLTRAAATAALALFFQQSALIGGTIYMSRADNAISSGDGEYSHERTAPTSDVTCTNSQLLTLGTVNFV